MTDIHLKRTLAGLIPADPRAADALRKIKEGQIIRATIKRPRSVAHHRKLWVLLQMVVDATGRWPNAEALLTALKIHLGHCDIVQMPRGNRIPVPRSISFDAMDQHEFNTFYEDVVRAITQHVLPTLNDSQLKAQVEEALS